MSYISIRNCIPATLAAIMTGAVTFLAGATPVYEDPVFIEPEKQVVTESAADSFKVLFVGNSITRHGVYKELDWNIEAGMAASEEQFDYVHVTAGLLQEAMPEREIEVFYGNVNLLINAPEPASDPLALLGTNLPLPDLIVIQTGEHEGPDKTINAVAGCYEQFIIAPLAAISPHPRLIAVGAWYPTDGTPYPAWVQEINTVYREICQAYDIDFISIEAYATDPECRGFGTNHAVQWHPNNRGMAGYAQEISNAFRRNQPENGIEP